MVYLDNAATTKLDPAVLEVMEPYLSEQYGNPSAQYSIGIVARQAVERAREIVASCINADPEEIFFTSGGTESNNWIINQPIWSTAITSAIEHHSVLNNVILKPTGIEIGVDKYGLIKQDKFKEVVEYYKNEKNVLTTVMFANNEIGTIQEVETLAEICRENGIFFHTDAVQAFGHVKIDVKALKVDALSVSGHKFNGPKGIGFLYIRKGSSLNPLLRGGKQERHMRAGTENVAGIVGMAKAAEIANAKMKNETFKVNEIRNMLYGEITNKIPCAHLNGTADWRKRLPGSLNFRFDGVHGEELVEWFNQNEICVSSGSACATGTGEPSHVLTAIGLTPEEARSSVRFSIGRYNNLKEIPKVMEVLEYFINNIKRGE